jgi:Lamin Tail Domain/HYR domain
VTAGVVFTDTADNASFINSTNSTPNAPNDCTPPIRINEVQASDASGGPDWVELTNIGAQPVDLSGWVLTDDKDKDGDVIPSGTTLNPGAFITFEPNNENMVFSGPTTPASKPFGLGATGDEVRLYQAGAWNGSSTYVAADLVDSFVFENPSTAGLTGGAVLPQTLLADGDAAGGPWPVNVASPSSPETYARCSDGVSQVAADGIGAWEVTSTPTFGTTNECDGLFTAMPWPDTHHGQAVTIADNVDLGQNVSGLYYVGGDPTTTADDYMWAIQNGSSGLSGANKGDPGSLYKLVEDSSGNWGPAPGWEKGVPVRYLNDPTGEPDSEGVTAVDGLVYVASERDNTNNTVSKISVIEVDPNHIVMQNGDQDGDLNATHEWDLGPDLGPQNGMKNPETGIDPNNPGDANLGIEAIAFVPDSYLTSVGFKDEHTGALYNPADYPKHIDGGVFFVGLEKTGKLYGYVFNSDNTWTRIATVSTAFQTIQDLLWDPTQDALWATCDNGCQGRSSIIKVDTNADADEGTFQVVTVHSRPTGATENLNNEGFTLAPISECIDGSRRAYWSDDTDDDNHWLRSAYVDCTADTTPPVITASATPSPNANGWNNSSVTVSFNCTDSGSGVDPDYSSLGDQTLTASGSATGACVDNGGNVVSKTVTVKIDETAPSIKVPSSEVTVEAIGSKGATVNYSALVSTSDALSGVDAAGTGCSPASGTTFPLGTTTVTCHATDLAGNSASATFLVDVVRTGPLTIGAGQSAVIPQGGSVTGPLKVQAGGSLIVQGGSITGPLDISGAVSVQMCGATITGPVTITGATGAVVLGDGGACGGNTITGPVSITGNHGGVEFDHNVVTGPLTITGNTGTIDVTGNKVTGPVKAQS